MPKEVFPDTRGPWTYDEAPETSDGQPVTHKVDLALELGWGIESMVHIGSANLALPEPASPARGWVVELDRESINRLIRTLRKARDQAFGIDE